MIAAKGLNCASKNPESMIGGVMNCHSMRGLFCAISMASIGLLAQQPPGANNAQTPPQAKVPQTTGTAPRAQSVPPFALAKKNETVVIDGRGWNLSELRPAWTSDQKSARRIRTRSSRTRAPRAQAARVSSPHQNH
jgi:hypothetical protein